MPIYHMFTGGERRRTSFCRVTLLAILSHRQGWAGAMTVCLAACAMGDGSIIRELRHPAANPASSSPADLISYLNRENGPSDEQQNHPELLGTRIESIYNEWFNKLMTGQSILFLIGISFLLFMQGKPCHQGHIRQDQSWLNVLLLCMPPILGQIPLCALFVLSLAIANCMFKNRVAGYILWRESSILWYIWAFAVLFSHLLPFWQSVQNVVLFSIW